MRVALLVEEWRRGSLGGGGAAECELRFVRFCKLFVVRLSRVQNITLRYVY